MKKILVTGAEGLIGQALQRVAALGPMNHYAFVGRKQADLTKEADVEAMFAFYKPDYVIHAAAKVGGIGGNMAAHADYFYQNILINSHMIHHAVKHGVKKFLAFSSVCVFPDDSQVLREDIIHNGPPFSGNFAYAHAKRMVDVQIRAYKSQHGIEDFCSIIPGNIYGTHDLYNPTHGHVIPSLIHKLYLAKRDTLPMSVWGDGKSLREFIFADDLAAVLLELLIMDKRLPERLIISGEKQYSIREVVDMLAAAAKYEGEIAYELSKPNGQRSRSSDLSLFRSFFPDFAFTDIQKGLEISYSWFDNNYPNVRL